MALSSPASFKAEARWQRCCAVCGQSMGPWHAHHVVPRHILRRLKLPQHDPRGALRLCERCHMQFEWGGPGKVKIPVRCLTDQNICYVWETLGVTVGQIERKYESFDSDPRWRRHKFFGRCEKCQLSQPMSPATA